MRISDWSSDVCSSDLCSLYCTPLSCGRPSCSIRYVLLSSVMTYPLVTLLVHAHPIRSGDATLAAPKDEYLRDRRVIAIAHNVQKRLDGPRLQIRCNMQHFHALIRIPIVHQAVLDFDKKAAAFVIYWGFDY